MNTETLLVVFSVLYGLAEALANIPYFKSNSPFQLVLNILKMLAGKSKDSTPQV